MNNFTYENDNFYLNGEKFIVKSGTVHYFRIMPEQWEDRLLKLKACGLNTVETYTPWNLIERHEGEFDFSGRNNIGEFLDLANKLGIYVILRPGPYVCAELDMGGLPSWLLTYCTMKFRCNNELFIQKVEKYLKKLFRIVRQRLCTNGGNIIMMQFENEYGSYGDDKEYLKQLERIYISNNINCLLFTSDGPNYYMLSGGNMEGYMTGSNFGSLPKQYFDLVKEYAPNQPSICMEYWLGWFDYWGAPHHVRDCKDATDTLEEMIKYGASFNLYTFEGGTNFGFINGANYDAGKYMPTITSYDFDGVLSECGDMTPKYFMIKELLEKYFGKAPEIEVSNSKKIGYGMVYLTSEAKLFDNLNNLSKPVKSSFPLTMEQLNQDFGFVVYSSIIEGPIEQFPLILDELHDRALIFIDNKLVGIKERAMNKDDEILISLKANEKIKIDILLENMGRVNYGTALHDMKGILNGISVGPRYHFGWDNYSLPLENLTALSYKEAQNNGDLPTFLSGMFFVREPADTFIKTEKFTKGVIFINGVNIGRYWNTMGPQKTLYIPAPILHTGMNNIVIFELEHYGSNYVELVSEPDLGQPSEKRF